MSKFLFFVFVVILGVACSMLTAYVFQYGWNHFVVLLHPAIPSIKDFLPVAGTLMLLSLCTNSYKYEPDGQSFDERMERIIYSIVKPLTSWLLLWMLTWFL
jgi:hypothetical protein